MEPILLTLSFYIQYVPDAKNLMPGAVSCKPEYSQAQHIPLATILQPSHFWLPLHSQPSERLGATQLHQNLTTRIKAQQLLDHFFWAWMDDLKEAPAGTVSLFVMEGAALKHTGRLVVSPLVEKFYNFAMTTKQQGMKECSELDTEHFGGLR